MEEGHQTPSAARSLDTTSPVPEAFQIESSDMRKAILGIQNDAGITVAEKAKRIQELMSSSWVPKRPSSRNSNVSRSNSSSRQDLEELENIAVSSEDKAKSFYAVEPKAVLGCKHYRRNCKKLAECCSTWFVCRFCHDEASDHAMDRHATRHMLCMFCETAQAAGPVCVNKTCGRQMARYYCERCKFWDDAESKHIFHCEKCRLCRVGDRESVVHCDRCGVCLNRSFAPEHRCIERSLECDCPICGEYLFTSTAPVMFMRCGHAIHFYCHCEHVKTSYQCPMCLKSLGNMGDYFQRIDDLMKTQNMPDEYRGIRSQILCNDCEKRSVAAFHFVYHKCQFPDCGSYNTKVLRTFSVNESANEIK